MVLVKVASGTPGERTYLSRVSATTVAVPRGVPVTCTAGPIVTNAAGDESVRLVIDAGDERRAFTIEQLAGEPLRRPPWMVQISRPGEAIVTVVCDAIADPDGGSRLPAAA